MKKIIVLCLTGLASMNAFANEQCEITPRPAKLKNTATTVRLPQRASGALLSLEGYSLDCDTEAKYHCTFKAETDDEMTTYKFGNGDIVTVVRAADGELRGPGTFKSRKYTHGEIAILRCETPTPVKH